MLGAQFNDESRTCSIIKDWVTMQSRCCVVSIVNRNKEEVSPMFTDWCVQRYVWCPKETEKP